MYWMRSENDIKGNREKLHELKGVGYEFKMDSYGYQVWFKSEYIHGAATATRKPKHYKHHKADRGMFLFHAVLTAHEHKEKTKEV